jgi:ribosomal protein L37AE/L43A
MKTRLLFKKRKPKIQLQGGPLKIKSKKRASRTVRLIGEVEHRCPYCLELVEKNDSRGVVVCSICQTHHHADCWAVTGMCQVPHHYK